MNWIVAGEVADEYVPMMLEEMGLDGRGRPRRRTGRPRLPRRVSGAGDRRRPVRLLAAIRPAGRYPFTVVEKNPGVGGTWWENSYPGARVDVGEPLLLLRASSRRTTDRVLRAPARTAVLFRRRRTAPRPARPDLLQHHRPRRRWDDATATWAVRVQTVEGDDAAGARGHLRRRAAQPAVHPRSPGRTASPGRLPHRPLGP